MELEQFVANALKQIMSGIRTAAEGQTAESKDGVISPVWEGDHARWAERDFQLVEFDIAVTVDEKKGTTAGMGIQVVSAVIGGRIEKSSSNSTVSRVKFSVPILPPMTVVKLPNV